jgi:hypothetical protein
MIDDDKEAQRIKLREHRKAQADAAFAECVAKYGDAEEADDGCRLVEASNRFFVLRRPTRGEYKRWKADVRESDSFDTLLIDCVYFPPKEEFAKLRDKYPALPDELGQTVLELAGLTNETLAKKR